MNIWFGYLEKFDGRVFTKYGDIPFIHWDKYERNRLDAYVERFGDRDGLAARVRRNLVDLRVALEEALVLPINSYSLKVVEKYIGYKRSLEEFGTNWSIRQYVTARDTEHNSLRASVMSVLLVYNKEDLEAMWHTLVWAKQRSCELAAAAA